MLDFYNSIFHKALEVVVLDCNVLRARSPLRGDRECDRTLIVFMHSERISNRTGFYLGGVIFKFDHEGDFLHKSYKW